MIRSHTIIVLRKILLAQNSDYSYISDISPPKKILKVDETLLDIGAIPGINLYFGLDQADTHGNQFLKAECISKAVSPKIALEVANYFRY